MYIGIKYDTYIHKNQGGRNMKMAETLMAVYTSSLFNGAIACGARAYKINNNKKTIT